MERRRRERLVDELLLGGGSEVGSGMREGRLGAKGRDCFTAFNDCSSPLSFRGINFVLSALVFNVFPTIFEVSLVTGILVRVKTEFYPHTFALTLIWWSVITP